MTPFSAPSVYEDDQGEVGVAPPALIWPSLSTSEFGRTWCAGRPAPDDRLYQWQDRARRLRSLDERQEEHSLDPRLDLALRPFQEALLEARRLIYILDLHAFDHALPVVADAMSVTSARDIRVLSKKDTARRSLWLEDGRGRRVRQSVSLQEAVVAMQAGRDESPSQRDAGIVEWRFLDAIDQDMVHDRFALIDDDLWHWGASVGGLHEGIQAVSHGWREPAIAFTQLFVELWEKGRRVS